MWILMALVALWLGAQAAIAETCADMKVGQWDEATASIPMTLTIDGVATKFIYGGSMATGTGINQWEPVDGGEPATDDGERINWNGRDLRLCK
jgi:hypothetical protein